MPNGQLPTEVKARLVVAIKFFKKYKKILFHQLTTTQNNHSSVKKPLRAGKLGFFFA